MNEEMGEVIEDVKQTESQKSVTTSNLYSLDFVDSGSEKHNSSGMETYLLEWESEGSESPHSNSVAIMKETPVKYVNVSRDVQCDVSKQYCTKCSCNYTKCSIISQEIFTQTSKTIIELAQKDESFMKRIDNKNTLPTQTSFMSITSNKTIEYQIEVLDKNNSKTKITNKYGDHLDKNTGNHFNNSSIEDNFSKLPQSENEFNKTNETTSVPSSEKLVNIVNEESELTSVEQIEIDTNSDYEHSDFEDDSLVESIKPIPSKSSNIEEECDTPKSVKRDVAELYANLYENTGFQSFEQEKKQPLGILTPLTEESTIRKDTSQNIISTNLSSPHDEDEDVLFTSESGIKVKMIKNHARDTEVLKLPPISNNSCPNSPKCGSSLFSMNPNKLQLRSGTLPCVFEERRDEKSNDRWEIGTRELASGENVLITDRFDYDRGAQTSIQLPPIHCEVGYMANASNFNKSEPRNTDVPRMDAQINVQNPININDKIRELKMSSKNKNNHQSKYSVHNSESRSGSPCSTYDENRLSENEERGCELLCLDLLKKLRSPSWFEVMDTLEDIPKMLDKFWDVIAEHRISDLLRQVIGHVESPRTQVARTACSTLAALLKNTNYTKKPDFYEAVTILLIKTGSFSRPVRRAANIALDDIVCGMELSHVVTALCIHGVTHKSPLVRCASARLLVVCCALGGGGRDLLRTRPPTAACARKHALRSLAALLDDKNTDARKYAERLYTMLRPLTNFEAFYLTDVDVELAAKQMKKYDHVLLCNTPESR